MSTELLEINEVAADDRLDSLFEESIEDTIPEIKMGICCSACHYFDSPEE